ncbi:hypothetical protein J5226_23435 [Lysobacter sp. K5869]|uniref:hypothetical protein n=1 Tax=Lysobacter sp. K5869 TaxID=2820808 RepID=UPI001C0629F4|nr:hypothetical protein [Lysobacter sp. K5869]QWP76498.1 hypothetical protein J5226_23435 [Lysobacter sp. K5869]
MRPLFKGMTIQTATVATLLLAAALGAGDASAHQTNPQCYLDGVQIRPVVEFRFTSKQVADFHAALLRRPPAPGGTCPAGKGAAGGMVTPRSCGQVDDHWDVATKMAAEYCAKVQTAARATTPVPVAEVNAPDSYRAADHHQSYTYKAATPTMLVLQGMCVICEVPAVSPAPKQKRGR